MWRRTDVAFSSVFLYSDLSLRSFVFLVLFWVILLTLIVHTLHTLRFVSSPATRFLCVLRSRFSDRYHSFSFCSSWFFFFLLLTSHLTFSFRGSLRSHLQFGFHVLHRFCTFCSDSRFFSQSLRFLRFISGSSFSFFLYVPLVLSRFCWSFCLYCDLRFKFSVLHFLIFQLHVSLSLPVFVRFPRSRSCFSDRFPVSRSFRSFHNPRFTLSFALRFLFHVFVFSVRFAILFILVCSRFVSRCFVLFHVSFVRFVSFDFVSSFVHLTHRSTFHFIHFLHVFSHLFVLDYLFSRFLHVSSFGPLVAFSFLSFLFYRSSFSSRFDLVTFSTCVWSFCVSAYRSPAFCCVLRFVLPFVSSFLWVFSHLPHFVSRFPFSFSAIPLRSVVSCVLHVCVFVTIFSLCPSRFGSFFSPLRCFPLRFVFMNFYSFVFVFFCVSFVCTSPFLHDRFLSPIVTRSSFTAFFIFWILCFLTLLISISGCVVLDLTFTISAARFTFLVSSFRYLLVFRLVFITRLSFSHLRSVHLSSFFFVFVCFHRWITFFLTFAFLSTDFVFVWILSSVTFVWVWILCFSLSVFCTLVLLVFWIRFRFLAFRYRFRFIWFFFFFRFVFRSAFFSGSDRFLSRFPVRFYSFLVFVTGLSFLRFFSLFSVVFFFVSFRSLHSFSGSVHVLHLSRSICFCVTAFCFVHIRSRLHSAISFHSLPLFTWSFCISFLLFDLEMRFVLLVYHLSTVSQSFWVISSILSFRRSSRSFRICLWSFPACWVFVRFLVRSLRHLTHLRFFVHVPLFWFSFSVLVFYLSSVPSILDRSFSPAPFSRRSFVFGSPFSFVFSHSALLPSLVSYFHLSFGSAFYCFLLGSFFTRFWSSLSAPVRFSFRLFPFLYSFAS